MVNPFHYEKRIRHVLSEKAEKLLKQAPESEIISVKYNIPIIEDAAYGDLEYDNPQKPLRALKLSKEHVIYLGSLFL